MPSFAERQQNMDDKRRVQTVPGAPEEEDYFCNAQLCKMTARCVLDLYDPSLDADNFICTKTCMNFSTS